MGCVVSAGVPVKRCMGSAVVNMAGQNLGGKPQQAISECDDQVSSPPAHAVNAKTKPYQVIQDVHSRGLAENWSRIRHGNGEKRQLMGAKRKMWDDSKDKYLLHDSIRLLTKVFHCVFCQL